MSSLLLRAAARSSRAVVCSRRAVLRPYSVTTQLFKRNDSDDDVNEDFEQFKTESSIQTMNIDISEEEAMKILEEELALIEEEKAAKFNPDWKPGQRKRPLVAAKHLEMFDDDEDVWTLRNKRCGGLGIKLGMMPVWDEWGERHPCTVLLMDTNIVTGHKTMEKHGYMAVQVGAGERKKKNVKATILGQYKDIPQVQEHPPYIIREFRVTEDSCFPEIGSQIHARHFVPGQNVDVAGISKGKGFQGAMKRWGFAGMPATHGVSKSHRALGSTGQCQDPGKVFKGKKMAGRMGTDRVTVQNLRIVKIDRGRNILYVRGAIPGQKGAFVEIRDAIKKPLWGTEKVIDELTKPPLPTFEFDPEQDGIGEPGFDEFMPIQDQDPLAPNEEAA